MNNQPLKKIAEQLLDEVHQFVTGSGPRDHRIVARQLAVQVTVRYLRLAVDRKVKEYRKLVEVGHREGYIAGVKAAGHRAPCGLDLSWKNSKIFAVINKPDTQTEDCILYSSPPEAASLRNWLEEKHIRRT